MKDLNLAITKILFAFFISFLILIGSESIAQTANSINITINIIPPYSPYYSDYAGPNAGKVFLMIQNLSTSQQTIKLTGELNGDNGIKINTKSNYVPLQPIVLNPNEVKQFNGLALKDIFDINSLNVYGINKSLIATTSRLPEGNYTFCIRAVDINTNKVLSSQAPLGCTSFSINYPDAPVLISPAANTVVNATTPQSLVLSWMNMGIVPPNIQYVLQIAEMPSVSSDPNQVLNATSFPLLNKTIIAGTTYVLSPTDPALLAGKKYAWRIKAIDPLGKTVFKNDGTSGASVFSYGNYQLLSPPIIKTPVDKTIFTPAPNGIYVNVTQPKINIEWQNPQNIANTISSYQLKLINVKEGLDLQTAFDTEVGLIYKANTTGTKLTISPKTMANTPAINNYDNLNEIKTDLVVGEKYAVQITETAKDFSGTPLQFSGLGKSNIVTFIYKANVDPNMQPLASNSSITGKLFYQFKKEQEPIKPTNFLLPGRLDIGNSVDNIGIGQQNTDLDYVANNLFAKNETAKALKNTPITFTYTIFKSPIKSINSYKNFKAANTGNYFSKGIKIGDVYFKSKDICTVLTQADGSFSKTFLNDYQFGYLGKVGADYYYAALQLTIKTPQNYFCSPDVLIFPQVGKNINLPDEVVFVNAYNLNVPVKATLDIKDQAVEGGMPISGYPVQIVDLHKYIAPHDDGANYVSYQVDVEDNLENMPTEGNSDSYASQSFDYLGENIAIADFQNTDAEGLAHFKNLLVSHTHSSVALEKKLEGNFAYKQSDLNKVENIGKDGNDYEIGGNFEGEGSVCFNSDFKLLTVLQKPIIIKPKLPQLYLRAIAVQNGVSKGIPNTIVKIDEYKNKSDIYPQSSNYYYTDENGYLKLDNLGLTTETQAGKTKVIGPYRTITLRKAGYKDKVIDKQLLVFGERFPASVEQQLEADGKAVGFVVNEKGEPVMAEVRVGSGPFIKTATNGWFSISNCQSGYEKIEIVPVIDNYFPESFYQLIKVGDYTIISNTNDKAGKNVVIEKMHRMQFTVLDANNKPINGSCTIIGNNTINRCYTSLSDGKTGVAAIASADNEFKIKTTANGFATNELYVNVPIGKTPQPITIKLDYGHTIAGTVVDSKTLKPIANARVFSLTGVNDEGEIQNEVYTDAQGKYILTGVKDNNLLTTVFAVKGGNGAYLQQSKSVMKLTKQVDFSLLALDMDASLWGIPIEINKAVTTQGKNLISGSFINLPANSTFKPYDAHLKLAFKDVEIVITSPVSLSFPGKNTFQTPLKSIKPVNKSIDILRSNLKVVAFDQYNCEVLGTKEEREIQNLQVSEGKGNGELRGYISSELSSFNFSYNYNGKFLLGSNGIRIPGQPATDLVFKANYQTGPNAFKISALYNKSSFKIHDFDGSFTSGLFDKSGFDLNASVDLKIPLISNTKLEVGKIKIDTKSIVWSQYTGTINLGLEKWALYGTGLKYEENQGGFSVQNGNLKTNLPQLALKNIIIRPTQIDLGASDLTGKEGLSLAGVTPLNLVSGAKMTLNYDDAASFDQQPHYRLNISNTANSDVAYIKIPGVLDNNDQVNFNMLSVYSDAKHQSILLKETDHKLYNIISQKISGVEVGTDYFTLIGNTNLQIPGANANITGRFKCTKSPTPNTINCSVEKLQTDLEMPGKVKFNGNKFDLHQNYFSASGDLIIYKNTPSDGINLKSTITKTPISIKNDILENEYINLKGQGEIAILKGGGNTVEENNWSFLAFTGKPRGFKTGNKELLIPGNDLIDFKVKGALSNVGGKKLEFSNLPSPFGDFSMEYDFENNAMAGALTLKNAGIPIGPLVLNDGIFDLQIDGKGFIVSGAISDARLAAIPILGKFKSGIAMGYYSSAIPTYMKKNLLKVTLYNDLPGLDTELKGVYVNVMKSLSKQDLLNEMGIANGPSLNDIPLVGHYVPQIDFSAGLDLSTILSLSNASVTINGKGFVNASIIEDIGACSLGFSTSREGDFKLKFGAEGFSGYVTFGLSGTLYYCVGNLSVSKDVTLQKNEGKNFKFKFGKPDGN
ncbi:carboxypeptidase regulatory-like domain-containing protein [Pedobacter sp. SD-b]|uniref:Carboxypeptidase regulatory-like domain-containing protein n=1 Tax=Pedobacter segetis TaxID=2793069 RepID=A0ABS1BN48_9SPHI|nr:carboxypeptidase-like regulatory domain-containing protein [Pedobacter segetis]MBK0384314.1 carboxypeptidase regulatory-like domain-containing protein [Pedobacter segetis]